MSKNLNSTRGLHQRWAPDEYLQRPKEFDADLADIICERLSNGEMLPAICDDRDMPMPGTFLRWCELDPALEAEYLRARRRGTEINLDEMVVAAHDNDPKQANVRSRALLEHIRLSDPKRYGPRATIQLKEDGEDEVGTIDYRAEVRRKLDAMAKKMQQTKENP